VRGYKEINLRALKILNPGGMLVTCSCSYHVGEEAFRAVINEAAQDARRRVRLVEARTQAPDHPILPAARETQYLKCLVLQAV
jgi:23S rRNA (cytosine1962-C5)-methyltransferase